MKVPCQIAPACYNGSLDSKNGEKDDMSTIELVGRKEALLQFLHLHGMDAVVQDGRLYCLCMVSHAKVGLWEQVDWSFQAVRDWLGY